MIYDYYLSENTNTKTFEEWDKEKEDSFNEGEKREKWKEKNKNEKYQEWLEEVFLKSLAQSKKQILDNNLKEWKNYDLFYPKSEDLKFFPANSVLIKISFTLKKPYTSKDEGEFHLLVWNEKKKGKDELHQKIIENPIVRDKFTGLPMVRPSTWKGHLRFAAQRVEWGKEEEKKKIIKRLFGSEPDEKDSQLKGRLYFFPTYFTEEAERDVITPLKRDTRTPVKERGPISLEVIKPNKQGVFYLLYFPYPREDDFKEEQVKEDLKFLAEALKLMFYIYGFSAKKTSGFGVIRELNEGDIKVHPEDKKKIFSILYTKHNNIVKDGA